MNRARHLLIIALAGVFLAIQWAALQHSASHLRHELAAAGAHAHRAAAPASFTPLLVPSLQANDRSGDDHPHEHSAFEGGETPLDHPVELCLVFHGVDCKTGTPANVPVAVAGEHVPPAAVLPVMQQSRTAVAYRSRAPPVSLS